MIKGPNFDFPTFFPKHSQQQNTALIKETNTINFRHKSMLNQQIIPWSKDPTLTFLSSSPTFSTTENGFEENISINSNHKWVLNKKKSHDPTLTFLPILPKLSQQPETALRKLILSTFAITYKQPKKKNLP